MKLIVMWQTTTGGEDCLKLRIKSKLRITMFELTGSNLHEILLHLELIYKHIIGNLSSPKF